MEAALRLNGSSDSDDSSSESDSNGSTNSTSSEEDEGEHSLRGSDFSDPENSHYESSKGENSNNAATPDEHDNEPQIKRSPKTKERSGKKKSKRISMTKEEIQKLMKDTIANYEKNREPAELTLQKSKSQGHVQSKNSEMTIYSQLCPPTDQSGQTRDNRNIDSVMIGVQNMDVEET